EVLQSPPTWWPQDPTTSAWRLVFSIATDSSAVSGLIQESFWVYFKNSVVIAGMTLLLGIPITSLAAYANSKLHRGGTARTLFFFFIGTLMVPAALTLIPSFL